MHDLHLSIFPCLVSDRSEPIINQRIIIGSDRRPETKQGIEGKIVRFRSGRVRLGLGIRIADLNHIADLKLSVLAPAKFRLPI